MSLLLHIPFLSWATAEGRREEVQTLHPMLEALSLLPQCILQGLSPWFTVGPSHLHPRSLPLVGSSETGKGDTVFPIGFSCCFPHSCTREVLTFCVTGLVPLQERSPKMCECCLKDGLELCRSQNTLLLSPLPVRTKMGRGDRLDMILSTGASPSPSSWEEMQTVAHKSVPMATPNKTHGTELVGRGLSSCAFIYPCGNEKVRRALQYHHREIF